jgi:hypothetical protein
VLVKANTVITNRELNLRRGPFEFHREVPYAAVLNRILQGFLQDSEQAKRNFPGNAAGHARVGEINLHLLLFG